MNIEPQTCPYCNAVVPVAAGATAGQRVPCPRCGEAFTLHKPATSSSHLQQAATATAPAAPYLDVEHRLRAARTNRLIAAAMLGGMAFMAAIGLAYALYSKPDRRAHDTAMPPPPRHSPLADLPGPEPAAVTPPAALEALRWLPADATVIAGVQLAELRQTAAGRELLKHLFRIGKVEVSGDLLERWTGLKTDQIDHIILGLRADDPVPPRTVLVVRTSRPYDGAAVRAALGAEADADAAGRTVYKGKPRDGGLRPFVWFADERTLVIGLMEKHLEWVPERPAAALERLAPEVRELLETRLTSGGPVWVVGRSADWRRTGAALLLGALPETDADLLGRVRGFALQVQADAARGGATPPLLLASVQCDDADAAQALEKRLSAAQPPESDWKTAREGPWLTVQLRGDPMVLFKDLGK